MLRTVILTFCISMGIGNVLNGQYQIKNSNELEGYRSIPQEYVDIHINDTFFLSGEYLYYKLYCLDAQNNIPSTISKIAYVELIASDGKIVFEHKIKLNKGQGQGEFFIPTSTPSGSYKLIGYTRWMLNTGQEVFFKADVAVVNPYKELDGSMRFVGEKQPIDSIFSVQAIENESITQKEAEHYQINTPKGKYIKEGLVDDLPSEVSDSLWSDVEKKSQDPVVQERFQSIDFPIQTKHDHFKLILPKKIYHKRELVKLEIKNNQSLVGGIFSISVRKTDALPRFSMPNPVNMKSKTKVGLNQIELGDSIFLPELRGELLSGTLKAKDGTPLPNQKMVLSLSKTYPIIKTVITDEKGKFFVNINEEDRSGELELLVLGDDDNGKHIMLDEFDSVDHRDFTFNQLKVSPEMVKIILERSVHNQIESAYFHKRNDSTLVGNIEHKFLSDLSEVYILNDYRRFSSLRETIVEIIDNVWIKKEKDSYKIQIRGTESFFVDSNEIPLVFLDGIFVKDLNSLIEYDIRKVESIAVSRDKYYMGAHVFHGILSISTSDQNFKTSTDDLVFKETLLPPLLKKKYFFQGYGARVTDAQRKYPDFRYQLFWQPELEIKGEKTEVGFYTSDTIGDFKIVIKGYTNDGRPVSLSEIIRVQL